ncbi:putative Glycine--tRNA ligase [Blattamonas nauphoetae]|uniref:glycine--tRNA ligase n=1 Tax=Blattamonas nauphoetae TaxID=2049346 RepID=A0ABQ9XWZ2_9EUKA|nr:putative Glycine--tRNA ligase [Blattamonas nauphoetae]
MPPKKEKTEADLLKEKNQQLQTLMKERFFTNPAFDLYGGKAGLHDLGPVMAPLFHNVIQEWRRHFVFHDNLQEIDATVITPSRVLEVSGHVEKFNDMKIKEKTTGELYRADKLIEELCDKALNPKQPLDPQLKEKYTIMKNEADSMSADQMKATIEELVKVTGDKRQFEDPAPFNLMFSTQIGPTGDDPAYLRPEIAQGMFMNFKACYEELNHRMPFGIAQFGKAFRNEIAPKGGLFRLREFQLAEFEYFYDPQQTTHSNLSLVKDVVVLMLTREMQEKGIEVPLEMTIEQAHTTNNPETGKPYVENQILAYYLGRTQLFLEKVGLRKEKIRFRQHLRKQMAHYARDCWDGEALSLTGWQEIVGIADRSAYDLEAHSRGTNTQLVAKRDLPEPIQKTVLVPVSKVIGQTFKQKAKPVQSYLNSLDEAGVLALKQQIETNQKATITISEGEQIELSPAMLEFKVETVREEDYIPFVVEPSYGISRILFSIIDQNFWTRPSDQNRRVISFPATLAPKQVLIQPLSVKSQKQLEICHSIEASLKHFSRLIDTGGASVGKKYARADEIGMPFGITVDGTSETDNTATLRERDSSQQVRLPITEIPKVLKKLVKGSANWETIVSQYGLVPTAEAKE